MDHRVMDLSSLLKALTVDSDGTHDFVKEDSSYVWNKIDVPHGFTGYGYMESPAGFLPMHQWDYSPSGRYAVGLIRQDTEFSRTFHRFLILNVMTTRCDVYRLPVKDTADTDEHSAVGIPDFQIPSSVYWLSDDTLVFCDYTYCPPESDSSSPIDPSFPGCSFNQHVVQLDHSSHTFSAVFTRNNRISISRYLLFRWKISRRRANARIRERTLKVSVGNERYIMSVSDQLAVKSFGLFLYPMDPRSDSQPIQMMFNSKFREENPLYKMYLNSDASFSNGEGGCLFFFHKNYTSNRNTRSAVSYTEYIDVSSKCVMVDISKWLAYLSKGSCQSQGEINPISLHEFARQCQSINRIHIKRWTPITWHSIGHDTVVSTLCENHGDGESKFKWLVHRFDTREFRCSTATVNLPSSFDSKQDQLCSVHPCGQLYIWCSRTNFDALDRIFYLSARDLPMQTPSTPVPSTVPGLKCLSQRVVRRHVARYDLSEPDYIYDLVFKE